MGPAACKQRGSRARFGIGLHTGAVFDPDDTRQASRWARGYGFCNRRIRARMTSIRTVAELEERLSRPTMADISAMAELDGDLLILGAGGKMGPSLAALARRAADQAKVRKRIIAVSRFADDSLRDLLSSQNIETIACDLLEPGTLAKLPDAGNVIFMAARKFGTTGSAHLTWAMNTYLPGLVAERYRDSRIVTFSTGNVYPLQPVHQGGAVESTPIDPH